VSMQFDLVKAVAPQELRMVIDKIYADGKHDPDVSETDQLLAAIDILSDGLRFGNWPRSTTLTVESLRPIPLRRNDSDPMFGYVLKWGAKIAHIYSDGYLLDGKVHSTTACGLNLTDARRFKTREGFNVCKRCAPNQSQMMEESK
jgi:hypothetical protein